MLNQNDYKTKRINMLTLSEDCRSELLQHFVELWHQVHSQEAHEYFNYLFNPGDTRLIHTVVVIYQQQQNNLFESLTSFFSFIVEQINLKGSPTLIQRVFVMNAKEQQGNARASFFFMKESIYFMLHKYTSINLLFTPSFFYGELSPSSYYIITKYIPHAYPRYNVENRYLQSVYEQIKGNFLANHVLPKIAVLKPNFSEEKIDKANNPNMIFYRKLNPNYRNGYLLPTIIPIHLFTVSIFIINFLLDRLINFTSSTINNSLKLFSSFFRGDSDNNQIEKTETTTDSKLKYR